MRVGTAIAYCATLAALVALVLTGHGAALVMAAGVIGAIIIFIFLVVAVL